MAASRRNKRWIVYRAVNVLNGHHYIGMTGQTLAARRCGHKAGALHETGRKRTKFLDALRAYGMEAFQFTIAAAFESREECAAEEVRLIAYEKPHYNIGPGGEGVLPPSPEHFDKFVKGRVFACERRKKPVICLSDGRVFESGVQAAKYYGVTQAALCHALKGKSASTAGKMFAYFTGSEGRLTDADQLVATARKRQRALIGEACRRSVTCETDGESFESVSAAASFYGVAIKRISSVLSGKKSHWRGLRFVYSDDRREGKVTRVKRPIRLSGNSKAIECLDDGKKFSSARQASQHYGLNVGAASAVALGTIASAGGLRFSYVGIDP